VSEPAVVAALAQEVDKVLGLGEVLGREALDLLEHRD